MTNYFEVVTKLAEEGKTTGANQSEAMIHYTQLAAQRMKRWHKVGQLLPETKAALAAIKEDQHWVVLTESWCGDAAHAIMFIEKMADNNPHISLEWKLRDENLDLMDQYLTNGGRAIPKLIAFDKDGNELFNWGPRPQPIQDKFWELKEAGVSHEDSQLVIQKMYNDDKGESMQKEIISLLNQI